jgi:predicted hydrolase (HD superfamily)
MRRHPVIGCELLKDTSGVSPEILDGVKGTTTNIWTVLVIPTG